MDKIDTDDKGNPIGNVFSIVEFIDIDSHNSWILYL